MQPGMRIVRLLRRLAAAREGAGSVEFAAIMAFFLLPLVIMVIDLGEGMYKLMEVGNSARAGAEYATYCHCADDSQIAPVAGPGPRHDRQRPYGAVLRVHNRRRISIVELHQCRWNDDDSRRWRPHPGSGSHGLQGPGLERNDEPAGLQCRGHDGMRGRQRPRDLCDGNCQHEIHPAPALSRGCSGQRLFHAERQRHRADLLRCPR